MSRTLAREKRGSEQGHEEERVDSAVKEGRFQEGEGGQARTTFPEEKEGSMSGRVDTKALQDDLKSLGFPFFLVKPEMGNEVG